MNATLRSPPPSSTARATGLFALFGLLGLGAMKLWSLTHRGAHAAYHMVAPLPPKPAVDGQRAVCCDGCIDLVHEASEDSFPASDRPACTARSEPRIPVCPMARPDTPRPADPTGTPTEGVPVRRLRGGDIATWLDREWLVTNGLGGYACGTIAGAAT